MTEEDLVTAIFAKEGDAYGDQATKPPIDQPTARGGIILATLQQYYDETEPGRRATVLDLQTMSHAQAREIVRWKLRQLAKRYHLAFIAYEPLRIQMLDFAYNSPAELAIRWLQRVLRVPRTGRMDDATFRALAGSDPWLVNEALVAARLRMIDMSTDGGSIDKRFEEGLENRAHKFSLLEVP